MIGIHWKLPRNFETWIKRIGIFSVLICLAACSKSKKADSFDEYFSSAKEISLERIPFEPVSGSPFFSNMFLLGYIDSVIVVNEMFDRDFTFKLVDLKSGKVKKFGKRGEGPNELISEAGYFLIDHQKHQLIIGDGYFNYVYEVDDLFQEDALPVESFRFQTGDDRFMGHKVIVEGEVFGASYLKRFASYNVKNELFQTYEGYPDGEIQALAHQAYFLVHPKDFKIAYGMRSYPEFGIIKKVDEQLEIEKWNWGDETSKVEENADGSREVVGSLDDELHFFSTAAGNESMYFLYSGAKLREEDGQIRKTGLLPQVVYQLDREGSPKAVIKLDQVVKAIAVDPDEKLLFAASSSENPELLVYKLP